MVQPFVVGAEARLTAQVQGQVHAEPGVLRGRVDQVPQGRLAAQGEIAALGEVFAGDVPRVETRDGARRGAGLEAGGIDEAGGDEFG